MLADLVRLPSEDELATWGEPVSLLCIGPREYDVMRASFKAWKPFLAPDASVVFYGVTADSGASQRLIVELEREGALKRNGQVRDTFICRSKSAPSETKLSRDRKAASDLVAELARARGLEPGDVLDRLAHSSFVSPTYRYLYIETAKCACTSMKYFITELEKPICELSRKPYLRETRRSMLIHQRNYIGLPTLLDLQPGEIREIVSGNSDYFIFGLVRNPFSRLVSAFESKVRLVEPGFENGPRWTAAEIGTDIRATFADFVARQLKSLGAKEHHFATQYRLLFQHLMPYTKIFQVERFAEFEKFFLSYLKAYDATNLPRFKDRNRTLYPDWRLYYDEATASRAQEYYREDFEAFGYDPNSWRVDGELPDLRTSPEESYWRKELIDRNEMIEFLYELLARRA